MGLFRRRPKAVAGSGPSEEPSAPAPRTVLERIEVTVEREWVSMVVRNPALGFTVDGAGKEGGAPVEGEVGAEKKLDGPDAEKPKSD